MHRKSDPYAHGSRPSCGPEIPQVVPPSQTASISDATDSLWHLRSVLSDLVSPPDIETQHMPIPTAVRAGLSVTHQLDDILSSTQMPQPTPSRLRTICLSVKQLSHDIQGMWGMHLSNLLVKLYLMRDVD